MATQGGGWKGRGRAALAGAAQAGEAAGAGQGGADGGWLRGRGDQDGCGVPGLFCPLVSPRRSPARTHHPHTRVDGVLRWLSADGSASLALRRRRRLGEREVAGGTRAGRGSSSGTEQAEGRYGRQVLPTVPHRWRFLTAPGVSRGRCRAVAAAVEQEEAAVGRKVDARGQAADADGLRSTLW